MPVPQYGGARLAARTSQAEELAQDAPAGELLGTISQERVREAGDQWQGFGPPPWASSPEFHDSDARRFVVSPPNVALRWMNPKRVADKGLRSWQKVDAKGDNRFALRKGYEYMHAPDNTIRRGDHQGDFLAWMPLAWVNDLQQRKIEVARRAAASSVDRQQRLKDELRRGGYGPYIQTVETTHPSHTAADGRTMDRD